jgi:hypothetical protein
MNGMNPPTLIIPSIQLDGIFFPAVYTLSRRGKASADTKGWDD